MYSQTTQHDSTNYVPYINTKRDLSRKTGQTAGLNIVSNAPIASSTPSSVIYVPTIPQSDEITLIQQSQNTDQTSLRALLDRLADAYHNSVSLVSDSTYDTLVDIYEEKFEKYDRVGAMPRGEKINLPYYLGSLKKIKKEAELTRWMQSYPGPYVIEDKVDGLTLLYVLTITPEGNRYEKIYTRGAGTVGMDVSHIIPYLNLPKLTRSIAVRGEIVMLRENFARVGQGFKNARNLVSGIVNSKENFNPILAKELKFIAYRIMVTTETPEQQVLILNSLGFTVPYAVTATSLTIDLLEQFYKQRKMTAPYEMDGLVIYQNKHVEYPGNEAPKHVIAFKTAYTSESVETVVKEVVWEASRYRRLKPVIIYQPVDLPAATLQRTSGDNARFILANGIGPGARIVITRSGDVIPRIVAVTQPAQPSLPDPAEHGNYTWDSNQVEFILIDDNNQVRAAKIEHFLDKLEVKNLGPGRITALVNAGFNTIQSVLTATSQQLSAVLGPTLGKNAYEEIKRKIQNVPLAKLMAASGIFPNVGEKRFELLVGAYPHMSLWWKCDPNLIAQAFKRVKGFKQLAFEIANRMSEFGAWLTAHPMITVQQLTAAPVSLSCSTLSAQPTPENTLLTINTSVPAIPQNLRNVTVVFSGFRSDDLKKQIQERGGRVTSSVSGITNFLIMKDLADVKRKAYKATRYGVNIIFLDQFKAQYLI